MPVPQNPWIQIPQVWKYTTLPPILQITVNPIVSGGMLMLVMFKTNESKSVQAVVHITLIPKCFKNRNWHIVSHF
jgi:hypothetical protein